MKKFTFLFLLTAFFSMSILAENVPIQEAEVVAKNVYYQFTGIKQVDIILSEPIISSDESTDLFYVFNIINYKGFVIVAADDRVIPVIGFSDEGSYPTEDRPVQFTEWMSGISKQIKYVIDNNLQATVEIDAEWQQYKCLAGNFVFEKSGKDVSPLLGSMAWNQSAGWNNECPVDAGGPGGHVYAGCVATAAGQVMMYWQYPDQGTGSHSYYHPTYGTLSADFGATNYNWAGMSPYSYTGDCPLLLFHLGVAFEMNYGPTGSGASSSDIEYVFPTYFGYKNSLEWVYKSSYNVTDWQNLIIAELEADRPMTYRGNNSSGGGGHSFVLDGVIGNDYFHFNWGWSGSGNGYYYLTNLNPGYDFTYNQAGCRGIEPMETHTYNPPLNLSRSITDNNVTLTWEEPIGYGIPEWYSYAELGDLTNLNWPGPERATLFNDADFNFSYPAEISKINHVFYEHTSYPWPDATFHFKIYATNGTTLLYESGDIEAAHLQVIEHTLTNPIEVTGDFYVVIVPVDASGHPSSGSLSPPVGTSHSYNGSAGNWTLYPDYEYITGVYIASETADTKGGKAEKFIYNENVENYIINEVVEIDYSKTAQISDNDLTAVKSLKSKALTGYIVFRDDVDISGTLPSGTLTYLDAEVPNGEYLYCVKAVYDGGTSECSNDVYAMINYIHVNVNEINDNLRIYPVPTKGELNIDFGQTQEYFVEIKDITGKNICSESGNTSHLNLNVSGYSKGMYILKITLNKEIITQKIIIE